MTGAWARSGVSLFAVTLTLLGGTPSAALASPYRPPEIADLSFRLERSASVWFPGGVVAVSFYVRDTFRSQDVPIVDEAVDGGILRSWVLVTGFSYTQGATTRVCRGDSYNLNVYVVEPWLLYDRRRFAYVYNSPNVAASSTFYLYAYYDSTPAVENQSAIVLGNYDLGMTRENFRHELAHYWWDRLCLASTLPRWTTESFAQAVETWVP